jgi:hypothetical protein
MTICIDTTGRDMTPTVRAYWRRAAGRALHRWERDMIAAPVTLVLPAKPFTPPSGAPAGVYQ